MTLIRSPSKTIKSLPSNVLKIFCKMVFFFFFFFFFGGGKLPTETVELVKILLSIMCVSKPPFFFFHTAVTVVSVWP